VHKFEVGTLDRDPLFSFTTSTPDRHLHQALAGSGGLTAARSGSGNIVGISGALKAAEALPALAAAGLSLAARHRIGLYPADIRYKVE
jgi:hypothetical protein